MGVFITGGTTGIGFELAKLYLKEGREVAICGRDLSKLSLQGLSTDEQKRLTSYQVDVKDRLELQKIIEDFDDKNSQEPLLVIANAGIPMGKKVAIPDFRRAEEIIETNIKGVLNTIEKSIELMLKRNLETSTSSNTRTRKGHIVLIGSVAGFNGLPHTSIYSSSKAAINKLGESLAIDLYQYGIDVTIIAPGFVDTPLTQLNKHPMPFLVPADKAAQMITNAIRKRKTFYSFPWPMKWATLFLSYLPRNFYIWVMRKIQKAYHL